MAEESRQPPQKPERPGLSRAFGSGMQGAGPYFGLGLEIMLSMVFFIVLGYFADRWLGTTPWLLIVGALLGFVAVGVTLWRVVRELEAQQRKKKGE